MLSESIRQAVCCDELQLAQTLNHCVEKGQQAKFNLLLSLLSPDVCDQPQFDFRPESPEKETVDWRHYFQLPKPQPLYSADPVLEQVQLQRWNTSVQHGYLRGVQLEQMLENVALCPCQQTLNIEILNNMSLLERLKYEERRGHLTASEPDENTVQPAAMVGVLNDFDYQQPVTLHSRGG
ncbi:VC2046/SO_2500 family protein [Celerinatantimonas sp. YJH-8]|uniref:VC2046/SO_2500 family protein n=1 Tax=Celerinatantimonas sp. YJH-8 TaxID=3228714 RepID=UPI0038C9FE1A